LFNISYLLGGISFNYLAQEIQRGLVVVKLNVLPVDPLGRVLALLDPEELVVEELVQPLVGVVDAQLFERILLVSVNPP